MDYNLKMSDILDIKQKPIYDNSVVKYEYHSYLPFLSSYNNSDEVRIPIQQQDLIVLPSESYIYIEGTLIKNDNSVSSSSILQKLVNNAMAFLFDEIRYELNGIEIDRNRNVGITSSIKNYISLTENESKMMFNASWVPFYDVALTNEHFNFCVPLKCLLGFAEDYRKIVINAKHELVLIRSKTDDNVLYTNNKDLKVSITKIQWKIPHITVGEEEKLSLLKLIERGNSIQMSFRSWDMYEYPILPTTSQHTWAVKTSNQLEKPRFVIFALQTKRKNKMDMDNSYFDHCNLTNIKLHLNSESFPYDDLNIKFEKNTYGVLYAMYANFQQAYYGRKPMPMLSWAKFKSIAPITVIDCLHQNEAIKSGPVDVRLEFQSSENIAEGTTAFCLLLHDRIIEYNPLTNAVKKII